jgi:hypothetical protein
MAPVSSRAHEPGYRVYLDFITGEEPEPGRAEPILRMLLR